MSVTPLPFSEFVDTTDSEQRWQIFSAIQGQTGLAENVTIVGPTDSNGYVNVDVKTQIGVGTVGAGGVPSSAFLVGYNAGNGNLNSVGPYSPLPIQFGNSVSLPAGSNAIGYLSSPSAPVYGQYSVTTSAAAIGSSTSLSTGITLTNTGSTNIYVGGSGVTTSNGYVLVGGTSVSFVVANLSSIYAIGSVAGTLSYIGS